MMFTLSNFKILAAIWRSVGVELVIFAITLIFAGLIKSMSGKSFFAKYDGCFKTENTLPIKKQTSTDDEQTDSSLRSRSSSMHADNTKLKRVAPWIQINEIMALMNENPGQRSAARALQMYSHLRVDLGLGSVEQVRNSRSTAIPAGDAIRRSKHTAINFYTMLVQCAVRSGQCYLVDRILEDMVSQNIPRTFPFYESTMKQLAGQKQYQLALKVYDRLHADGLEPSAVTYSCLINFAAELGEIERALSFFAKLASITTPSIRAYMTVFRALAKQRDWRRSIEIFRDMQKRNVRVDHLVFNVVLATGIAADKLEEVETLLAEVASEQNVPFDVVSYNTLLKGYAQRNDGAAACRALECMRKHGLEPTAISYNTVMDAIVRDKDPSSAWKIVAQMRAAGIKPDKFTCSILVKGLTKHPSDDQLQNLLDLLHEAGDSCEAPLKSALYHTVWKACACSSQ